MDYKFKLGEKVVIKISEESGVVIGRADYADGSKQVQVHYQDDNGCARTEWFAEHLLESEEVKDGEAASARKSDETPAEKAEFMESLISSIATVVFSPTKFFPIPSAELESKIKVYLDRSGMSNFTIKHLLAKLDYPVNKISPITLLETSLILKHLGYSRSKHSIGFADPTEYFYEKKA